MNDKGCLVIRRVMVPEGAKYPHEENCLRVGASICDLAMASQ